MSCSRRDFIGLAAAGLAAGCVGAKGGKGRFDDNFTVIFSDAHICGENARAAKFTPKRISAFVDEVLAMRPLPRRVVHLGDLAYLHGHPADYAVCSLEIKDFYFPAEPSDPNDRPAPWRIKVEKRRGATCTFLYDRQGV